MKISDISKDFNLKSKDVVDVFKEAGIEKKNSGAAVDEEEFEIFFSLITKSHQIKNIDAYTGGSVTISSVKEKAVKAEAPAAEAKPEAKAEAKPEPKPEVKVEPKAEEKKPEEKPAPKLEAKAEERPARKPMQDMNKPRDARPDQRQRQPQGAPQQRDNRPNSQNYYAPKNQYQKYNERPQDAKPDSVFIVSGSL